MVSEEQIKEIELLEIKYKEAVSQETAEVSVLMEKYKAKAVELKGKFDADIKALQEQADAVVEQIRKRSKQLLEEKQLLERAAFGMADGEVASLTILYKVVRGMMSPEPTPAVEPTTACDEQPTQPETGGTSEPDTQNN